MTPAARVLHVRIVTGTGGGPEKTILNSPRHLTRLGIDAAIVYLHPPGDPGFAVIEERARAAGTELIGIPESLPIDPRALRKLARICKQRGITVWHGHDYKSNLYGLLVRRFHRMQLVTTVHGWVKHTSRTPLYYAVDRWCLKRYERVIVVSADLERSCLELGVTRERLTMIENAIDTETFQRAQRRPAGERLRIGAVGRLSEEKGFELLIEAVERLASDGLDVELAIAGEGDLQSHLEARIAASPCRDRLQLLGFRADTVALFEGFDIFCLSSLREGLPNVVLEAMAMEVPVLATRSGGMQEFARDGEDALLCDPGSVDQLEAGLRRLVTDAGLRAQLAAAGRARIEADCSFATRMERVAALYSES